VNKANADIFKEVITMSDEVKDFLLQTAGGTRLAE